jgi:predicted RNase H-like nuclease (RuvC/YqgF family)
LNDSETATKNLKDESGRLADTITSKVIPAIDKELEKVAAQTAAYAAQREELLALIAEYEAYIEALNKQVEVQSAGFDKDTVQRRTYLALIKELQTSFINECF